VEEEEEERRARRNKEVIGQLHPLGALPDKFFLSVMRKVTWFALHV
jgi:hypothetical protein